MKAARLFSTGDIRLVDVHALITHKFPLENIGQAFATAQRREGLKVVVQVTQEEPKI